MPLRVAPSEYVPALCDSLLWPGSGSVLLRHELRFLGLWDACLPVSATAPVRSPLATEGSPAALSMDNTTGVGFGGARLLARQSKGEP